MPVKFILNISPCYDPFQLLDTFMANSDYAFALSLTVCEPHLDQQSNTVSWPVIHWYCDLDMSNEISVEEVKALFGVEVTFCTSGVLYQVPKKQLSTIVEINTMYGFDPHSRVQIYASILIFLTWKSLKIQLKLFLVCEI